MEIDVELQIDPLSIPEDIVCPREFHFYRLPLAIGMTALLVYLFDGDKQEVVLTRESANRVLVKIPRSR